VIILKSSLFIFIVFFLAIPLFARANDPYLGLRRKMVQTQIKARGIKDQRVLEALVKVPRHLFVPSEYQYQAYEDYPLPIGEGQTISQPYIVALMTELLQPDSHKKILEIGTGSGYQAAILGELVKNLYTIEIVEKLAETAEKRLDHMGYKNIKVKAGDGYHGWPEHAPFDGIIVTAAPEHIPAPLVKQLKVGGIMVLPVGEFFQQLQVVKKTEKEIIRKNIIPVRFVPMTGEVQRVK
jgi:protein-L-isoaspartate(D-aspartate) O-methyltransferase